MRAMVEMTARRDYAFDNSYHRPLQGKIYGVLNGTKYEHIHDGNDMNLFSYSPPIPPHNTEEGETRRLIFAGHDPDLVTTIVTSLCREPELNLSEMPFYVEEAYSLNANVGESGTLTTGSPLIVRFNQQTAEEHGIDTKYEKTYWRPEHGTDLFFDHLNGNIQQKYRSAYGEEPPEPPYFTGFSLENDVAKPLYYDQKEVVYVGSEWKFEYEVESGKHRKLLKLALNAGLGELNGLGFGFMNRDEDVNNGPDSGGDAAA